MSSQPIIKSRDSIPLWKAFLRLPTLLYPLAVLAGYLIMALLNKFAPRVVRWLGWGLDPSDEPA